MKSTSTAYETISGRVLEAGDRFEHVMALTLDPASDFKSGLIRCIVSREGDVGTEGFVDRSELFLVDTDSSDQLIIGQKCVIAKEDEIVTRLLHNIIANHGDGWEYLGHEDPDLHIGDDERKHLYFTMPFLQKGNDIMIILLGHAVGDKLNTLEMTMSVLMQSDEKILDISDIAKELSFAPKSSTGIRHHLIESADRVSGSWVSLVRVVHAKNEGGLWQRGEVVLHPHKAGIPWIAEHAPPGPLLPQSFVDLGPGRRLGIMNGRSASSLIDGEKVFGPFTIGLFIYNYEEGKIEWISPKSIIEDKQARSVTFASEFVENQDKTGTLYAHIV